ncbi:hypothetical protein GMJAKD_10505 [Candidatus Electrothrix aarhusensis]
MKNLVKKSMAPAFAAAFCFLAAGQAQAVSVSVFEVTDPHSLTQNAGIIGWLNDRGMVNDDPYKNVTILEDFEGKDADWYKRLNTGVGKFIAKGDPGTGSTSYNAKTGSNSSDPYFEVRDYDANGRYNVYPFHTGENYLDSADISNLSLNLNPGYKNIFFTVTDPGDVAGMTTSRGVVKVDGAPNEVGFDAIGSGNANGSLWFVGIDGEGEDLTKITWSVKRDGDKYTNDGFGLDSFGTVSNSVPEPATALLLGAGLLPLMGFLRRKKEDEV